MSEFNDGSDSFDTRQYCISARFGEEDTLLNLDILLISFYGQAFLGICADRE